MGSVIFEILGAGGLAPALSLIAEKLSDLATTVKIPATVMLALGAVAAILIGTLGYKYIKLFSTVCFALIGYGAGEALFRTAQTTNGWNVPDFARIIAGVVLLVFLGFLAYKKIAYALFGVAGFSAFVLSYFIYPNYIVAAAVGIVIAMVSMYFVRHAFIIITSFYAGFGFLGMVSAMAPTVKLLQLSGVVGKISAFVITLIFVLIQLSASRKETQKFRATKRVKIRRVFDAW